LQLICANIDEFVDLTNVITPAYFGSRILIAFFRLSGGKTHFPFMKQTANMQCNPLPRWLVIIMEQTMQLFSKEVPFGELDNEDNLYFGLQSQNLPMFWR